MVKRIKSLEDIENTHLGLEDATEELRKMEEERAREEIFRGKQRQQETRLSPRMLRVVQ